MSKTKLKTLTLKEKIDVIKIKERNEKIGARAVAQQFGVGKTQIQSIWKRKRELLNEFELNEPSEKKRNLRKTGNEEINKLCWEWFKDVSSRQLPISGPLLQERALKFAADLDNAEFKASNGWLEAFRKRHNITFVARCGESADVDDDVVDNWKEKLPTLYEGYEPKDIYNMDETGLFFRTTTDKTLFIKGDRCSGGKKAKVRMTVGLCANMIGEKEKPIVIWKYNNPRCFKKIEKKSLPVYYYANKKAWMTSLFFEDWLTKFDSRMRLQNRHILLFINNAPSHPRLTLTNIKLAFFPPNTTSKSQPMDQGIIQTMKLKFRKLQLQKLITKMDKDKSLSCSDFLKEIDILQAIQWLNESWKAVLPETISKCFRSCGFISSGESYESTDNDLCNELFGADLGDVLDIASDGRDQQSWDRIAQDIFGLSLEELNEIEQEMMVCDDTQINWEKSPSELLENLDETFDEQESDAEEENDVPSLSEAINQLSGLRNLAIAMGNIDALDHVSNLSSIFEREFLRNRNRCRQSHVTDYFNFK